jgi:hypothetical protein
LGSIRKREGATLRFCPQAALFKHVSMHITRIIISIYPFENYNQLLGDKDIPFAEAID